MTGMKPRLLLLLALSVPSAVVVACVSDDPVAGPQSGADAGSDGSVLPGSDASTPDGGGGDGAPGGRCVLTAEFGAPSLVDLGTGAGEDLSARFTPDENTVILSSTRPGRAKWTIVQASRSGAGFGGPLQVFLTGDTASYDELNPTITADRRLVIFSAAGFNDAGDPFRGRVLYYATSSTTPGTFGSPKPLLGGLYSEDDADPYLLPDGRALYFTATNGGRREILRMSAQSPDAGGTLYGTAEGILSDATTQYAAPVVSQDELTMFVAQGNGDPNQWDVTILTRSSTLDRFANPRKLDAVNSTFFDIPTWISPDGCALYFTSRRSGAMRTYVARRPAQ